MTSEIKSGIDTITLWTRHFSVQQNHILTIKGESRVPLFRIAPTVNNVPEKVESRIAVYAQRAFIPKTTYRFSVDINHRYSREGLLSTILKINLSVPTYLRAENTTPASANDLLQAIRKMHGDLRKAGIETDLLTARMCRIDVTHDLSSEHTFLTLKPILEILERWVRERSVPTFDSKRTSGGKQK